MARQQDSLPATDAKLIDTIGVDVVSKALDKGVSTVRRWRSRGVPKKYQAALAKLVEKDRRTSAKAEGSISDDDKHTNALPDLGRGLAALTQISGLSAADPDPSPMPTRPEDTVAPILQDSPPAVEPVGRIRRFLDNIDPTLLSPSALPDSPPPPIDDQEAPFEHIGAEGALAGMSQDCPVETKSADDIAEQDAPSARERRRRRRAKRQHARAADPSHPQQTGPAIERPEAPSAPPIAPSAIKHEKKPVRLNRQTAIIAGVALVSAISLGLAQGLRQVSSTPNETEAEQPQISQPPARAILPDFTYADVTRPPAPTVTKAALAVADNLQRKSEVEPSSPDALAAPDASVASTVTATQSGAPARDQHDEEEESALQSGLFPAGAPAASGTRPAAAAAAPQGEDGALAALNQLRQNLPTPQDLLPPGQPSAGDQQQSFLDAKLDETIYLKNGLEKPLSDYEVKAGTIIPAALITGLNSDLPGEIIGQVTEHVYDTASGQHLLIPQGAKILGRYNAEVSYGQERAQLVWDRLILPNGDSVQLEAMVGTDKAGYAGLVDEVDHHFGQLVGAVILSSFISVGANLATDSGDNVADALGDATAQQASEIGGEIVDRQLDIQPTITVRPGFKLNILVNKNMILEPYQAG